VGYHPRSARNIEPDVHYQMDVKGTFPFYFIRRQLSVSMAHSV
jgi:hypothetical protein